MNLSCMLLASLLPSSAQKLLAMHIVLMLVTNSLHDKLFNQHSIDPNLRGSSDEMWILDSCLLVANTTILQSCALKTLRHIRLQIYMLKSKSKDE